MTEGGVFVGHKATVGHIFDSFFRGSNVEKNKGSGLGLYICRELMHLMGLPHEFEMQGEPLKTYAQIGQNVPVRTAQWIVSEALRAFERDNDLEEKKAVRFFVSYCFIIQNWICLRLFTKRSGGGFFTGFVIFM